MMSVDAHAHFVSPELLRRAAAWTDGLVAPVESEGGVAFIVGDREISHEIPLEVFDVDRRIAWMDQQGIDVQIVSTWSQLYGYHLASIDAVAWVQLMNEAMLSALEGFTDRLKPLAALPLSEPKVSADLISEARDQGFVGAVVGTDAGGVELDDRSLDPVWAAASKAGMPLFMHPEARSADLRLRDYGLMNAVGRGYDTTVACSRLLMAGTLDRFPDLKILVAHGGGALPYLSGRLQRNHSIHPHTTTDPSSAMSRLYFDTVLFRPESLEFLVNVSGVSQVLCGSDNPLPIQDAAPLSVVWRSKLNDGDKQAVIHENAVRLFGL